MGAVTLIASGLYVLNAYYSGILVAEESGLYVLNAYYSGILVAEEDALSVYDHLSVLRHHGDGNDADQCVPVSYECSGCGRTPRPKPGDLLRILLLRFDAMSVDSGTAIELQRHEPLLKPSRERCAALCAAEIFGEPMVAMGS